MDTTYLATTIWVIFVDLIVLAAGIWLLKIGRASTRALTLFGILSLAWIGFLHFVFAGKNLIPSDISGVSFYFIILAGVGISFLVFYTTSFKTFLNLKQDHIQIAQGLRVFVGAGFLMEGSVGVIPSWFGIMDGYLHVTSGFLALIAAIAFIKQMSSDKKLLWLANIVGIADVLIIATSICFFVWTDLGPYHNMMYVVFYAAPIVLWLHLISVVKLLKRVE